MNLSKKTFQETVLVTLNSFLKLPAGQNQVPSKKMLRSQQALLSRDLTIFPSARSALSPSPHLTKGRYTGMNIPEYFSAATV